MNYKTFIKRVDFKTKLSKNPNEFDDEDNEVLKFLLRDDMFTIVYNGFIDLKDELYHFRNLTKKINNPRIHNWNQIEDILNELFKMLLEVIDDHKTHLNKANVIRVMKDEYIMTIDIEERELFVRLGDATTTSYISDPYFNRDTLEEYYV